MAIGPRHILAALVVGSVALATGCGGGGGGGGVHGHSSSSGSGTTGGGQQPGFVGNDFDAPVIDVTSPARGAYLDRSTNPGTSVTVEGSVTDGAGSGVQSVEVNGQGVHLDPNGNFRTIVALFDGGNAIVVVASDFAGNESRSVRSVVFSERYEPPAQRIEHSLGARINEGALNAVGPAVMQAVVSSGVIQQQLLNGGQPIWRDNTSYPIVGGCFLSIQVTITNVQYGTPTLTFDCFPGEVQATVRVPNLVISAEADDWCGVPYWAVTGDVSATSANATLGMSIAVDPATGQVHLTATQSKVDLQGYNVNFTNLPGQIIGIFPVAAAIQGPLQDAIADALRNDLPPKIEQELNGFLAPISRTWAGRTVTFEIDPTNVSVDDTGMLLEAASNVSAPTAPGLPTVPGSYFDPSHGVQLPLFAPVNPNLSISLLSNAWNRALYTSWQAGFWTLRIDQNFLNALGAGLPFALDSNLLRSYIPGFSAILPAGVNVPIAIDVEPHCQPILLPTPHGPNLARLTLPELHLSIYMDTTNAGGPGWQKIWEFAVHAEVGVDFQIVNGHELAVGFGGNAVFETELLSSSINLNGLDLSRFLTFLVPSAIQVIGRSIAPFPLPTFSAQNPVLFQGGTATVGVDGGADDYLTVKGDL